MAFATGTNWRLCLLFDAKYAANLGPDGSHLMMQGVRIADDSVIVVVTGTKWRVSQTDVCALLRAKCVTYSGLDGSLLLLQHVSVAEDFVMVFVAKTIAEGPFAHDCACFRSLYNDQNASLIAYSSLDLTAVDPVDSVRESTFLFCSLATTLSLKKLTKPAL
jgi:hypothetical protein